MDEVLKRKLFNTPKYEHKSTGIASGLEYRSGYRVGGRVGFARGRLVDYGKESIYDTDVDKESIYDTDVDLEKINPKLKLKPGGRGDFAIEDEDLKPDLGKLFRKEHGRGTFTPMYSAPFFDPDIDAEDLKPDPDDPFSTAYQDLPWSLPSSDYEEQVPTIKRELGQMEKIPKLGKLDDDGTNKEKVEFMYNADKERNKRYEEYDALRAAKREEYDAELKALRERQSSDKNKMALLNMISAANDPNLQVGQSRVAAGAGALTTAAQEKVAWRNAQAEQDLEIKGSRDEADLLLRQQRDERQIQNLEELEKYERKAQMDKIYKKNSILIQNIEWFENRLGKKLPKEKIEKILEEAVGGNDVDNQILDLLNSLPGVAKALRAQLDPKKEPSDDPITSAELEILKSQEFIYTGGEIPGGKDGGRVGYQVGGGVETEEGVPMVMTYDQLRDKLPPFITDDIVKLIAYSPEAFKDFANIETQQDVEEFNDKYDVNLVLPDPEQMDYAMPSTDAAQEPAAMPVPVPPAVAANPQMPMQTGTGQLTPTETALLDPTEQAIRMRNR